MKRAFFALLVLFALAACAPDPRREASAFATRLNAEELAADAQQAREHQGALAELELQNRQAAQAEWQRAVAYIIRVSAVAVAVALSALGCATAWAALGASRAYVVALERKANEIQLDRVTRQYPLLRQIGKNIMALANPNDNSVLLLDASRDADRAKVLAMANTQFAGALAHEARLASNPGAVAQIPAAQVIEMEDA